MNSLDFRFVSLSDLALLREIAGGDTRMRDGMIRLMRMKLLREIGYHERVLTVQGQLALQSLFIGGRFVIKQHRLLGLVGLTGTIIGMHDARVDSDGFDEDGLQIRWSKPFTYVTARLDDRTGEWCFYSPLTELEVAYQSGQPKGGYFARSL